MINSIITGASGFIGSNLVRRLLTNNHNVIVFNRNESKLWRLEDVLQKLEVHTVDMNNVKSLQTLIEKIQPQFIFHLATYGGYPSQQDIEIINQTNIINTNKNKCKYEKYTIAFCIDVFQSMMFFSLRK